jgi:hypothetical protein
MSWNTHSSGMQALKWHFLLLRTTRDTTDKSPISVHSRIAKVLKLCDTTLPSPHPKIMYIKLKKLLWSKSQLNMQYYCIADRLTFPIRPQITGHFWISFVYNWSLIWLLLTVQQFGICFQFFSRFMFYKISVTNTHMPVSSPSEMVYIPSAYTYNSPWDLSPNAYWSFECMITLWGPFVSSHRSPVFCFELKIVRINLLHWTVIFWIFDWV